MKEVVDPKGLEDLWGLMILPTFERIEHRQGAPGAIIRGEIGMLK
jgi:hypothetical protein